MSRRGRDFFVMFLARELKMTRRQMLASVDSYEMSMWQAFFKAENKPPEKKQSKEELAHQLKTVFAARQAKSKKKAKK
jgi:hypothetical protein